MVSEPDELLVRARRVARDGDTLDVVRMAIAEIIRAFGLHLELGVNESTRSLECRRGVRGWEEHWGGGCGPLEFVLTRMTAQRVGEWSADFTIVAEGHMSCGWRCSFWTMA